MTSVCAYPECDCKVLDIKTGQWMQQCAKGLPSVHDLTPNQLDLLRWLSESEFSQYGECHGTALNVLVNKTLAQIHGPGQHQHFIANDFAGTKGIMFQAVSLTDAGHQAVKDVWNHDHAADSL